MFPGRATGKDIVPGGQLMLTTEVENYPGYPDGITGPEMMQQFARQALRFDTRVVTDNGVKRGVDLNTEAPLYTMFQNVQSIDMSARPFHVVGDNGFEVDAHSVVIATGAKANWLGLDNEQRLAMSGGGVSACAVCDGALPMFRNAELAVVGGGDTAMEEAMYLAKFASKVHVMHRRDSFRASQIMQDRALANPKIQVMWNTVITDVLGDEKITGVRIRDTVNGDERDMPVGGLFLAIGHTPITGFLDGQLELDDTGYIVLKDPGGSTTSVEGIFAAGDVADSVYRQAVTAAGMGCRAALDAERWLGEHGLA
jgi:thioredoxin reductase (NADPH)